MFMNWTATSGDTGGILGVLVDTPECARQDQAGLEIVSMIEGQA